MTRFTRLIVGVSLTAGALGLPSLAAASGEDYVVTEGDTLVEIAANVGVPLRDLLAANGLSTSSLIVPGQHLVIPDAANDGAATSGGSTYTVSAGDTLIGIASRAGVSLRSLLAINGITAGSLITPGMEIRLPAGATTPSPVPVAAPSPVAAVVNYALAQVGKPYTFFTRGPAEFDCSGLTLAAYAQIGVNLVHHAASQARQGEAVDFWNDPIQAGDLVFLDGDWNGEIDHVGIALGSGMWVQATKTHDVVMTAPMPARSVIIAVRRYVD
jgi:cell wall-associated NlpC family hydrolase